MKDLDRLAIKYGTDKHMNHHGFVKHYAAHFGHLRGKNINLLEIGVKNGASLKMWQEYFPTIHITGIDILPKCKQYEKDNITIYIGDQNSEGFLQQVGIGKGDFDIIIDDGSHRWNSQIEGFKTLFPYLKSGGIYVIEDLHTSFVGVGNREGDNIYNVGQQTCMEYLHELADNLTKSRNKANKSVDFESIHFYKAMAAIIKS